MAIIYTYPTKENPVDEDLVLISDSEDGNKTKQVTIEEIRGATVSGVSQIVAGTNVTISPVTGTGVVTINASGGGSTDGWTTISGTSSNIIASAPSSTATFAVNTDSNLTIVGNGTDTLTYTLGVPTSLKKGAITALPGPTNIPTQSASGTWYPIDKVEEDQSRLAVRIPTSSGGVTDFTNSNGTFVSFGTTNTNATGAVTVGSIDLSATGTPSASNFLRGDNTWAVPATTSPAGSNTQVQFNNSGSFGASANLTFSTDTLSVQSIAIIKGDGATNPGKLRINCRTNSHYVEIAGPEHTGMVASYELALPNAAPSNNQILQSSGSGELSWIATPSDTNTNIANTNLTLNANRTTSLDDYNLNISSDNVSPATGGIVRFQNYDSTSAASPTGVRVDYNAQVDGQAYVTLHSGGTVTGNVSIDWNNGNVQELTLSGNVNITQANCKPGGTYILIVNQDEESLYTITWSTDFDWMDNNTAPGTITAARTDVYSFVCRTATSLLGTYAEDFIV